MHGWRVGGALVVAACAVPVLTGCGGSGHPVAVKANGCTAKPSGQRGGADVVTYSDASLAPSMTSAVQQAVQAWNTSGAHVVLTNAATSGSIDFVASTASTHTEKCTGHQVRTVTVFLNEKHFATGGTAKEPLSHLVAREIGHALGLAKAGPCGALMTTACKSVPAGPDAAEVAEIDKLYAAGAQQ